MAQPTKTKRTKKEEAVTSITKLESLGNDLVSHLTKIGSSWQDFCSFLCGSQEQPQPDPKRLRDFIAAYHELFRTLLDVQPAKGDAQDPSAGVVILPEVQQDP